MSTITALATREQATANMQVFAEDLVMTHDRFEAKTTIRDLKATSDGSYCFALDLTDNGQTSTFEINMPGVPLTRVRYHGHPSQHIEDYPRLWIDGVWLVWKYALTACTPHPDNDSR